MAKSHEIARTGNALKLSADKIVMLPVSEVRPYEKNPRKNAEAVKFVKASIEQFGFKVPIIIDSNRVIVCGHTRLLAAKSLGMDEVPCIMADDLTDDQIRAFRLADNKVGEFAEWDMDLLGDELDAIAAACDIDMGDFGFDLSDEEETEVVEDEVPEEVEPVCKKGELWQLGEHRLMCGDSTSADDVAKLMNGERADLVFTDPPYKIESGGGGESEIAKSLTVQKSDIDFISGFDPTDFLKILPAVFDKNMNAYVFCNKDLLPQYLNWAVENDYGFNVLIWKKPSAIPIKDAHRPDIEYLLFFRKKAIWNHSLEGVNYSRCLEYSRVQRSEENGNHPTPKPIALIGNELQISSNKGSVILDLFGGSGSTMMACEQLGRKCRMMELDPHYCDVIIARWEKLTGQKAVKLEG